MGDDIARSAHILEVCADSPASVAAAIRGGADQVELCGALALGGLTPSAGLARAAVALCRPAGVAVRAMVRVRPGGFDLDDEALALSIAEARALIDDGVDGLVFGATRGGAIDRDALRRFADEARAARPGIALTLHRVVDLLADPVSAIEPAIALGYDQILSSGGGESAWEGRHVLAQMVGVAGKRCRIVAGAGVRVGNAAALLDAARVGGLHGTARGAGSAPAEERFGFGAAPLPSDAQVIASLRATIDSFDRT